jgi:hypothetical protein
MLALSSPDNEETHIANETLLSLPIIFRHIMPLLSGMHSIEALLNTDIAGSTQP